MLFLGILFVATSGVFSQDVVTSLPKYTVTVGFGDATGCGPKSECDVYLPFGDFVNNKTFHPFFRTQFGRTMFRYLVECCDYPHPLEGLPSRSSPTVIPTERDCGFPAPSAAFDAQKHGAWPWLAGIGVQNGSDFEVLCGGSLITSRHVLTAAHCNIHKNLNAVVLGADDLHSSHDNTAVQTLGITKFTEQNNFNLDRSESDIAIITLEGDVKYNDYVRPVCLPFARRNDPFTGELVTVVGYGRTSAGGFSSTAVSFTNPIVELSQCQAVFSTVFDKQAEGSRKVIDNRNLCMSEEGGGACQGDAGSPLNYYDVLTRRYYVVGIVSWGLRCVSEGYPGINTRVGSFIGWIVQTITQP